MTRWRWFVLTVALLVCAPGQGQARDARPQVWVSQACDGTPDGARAWLALLRVELAEDGIDAQHAPQGGVRDALATRAHLEPQPCGNHARAATLTVWHAGHERTRTLALEHVAEVAQSRVIAIAMAALIRAALAQGVPRAAPSQAAVAPPASEPVPSAPEVPDSPPERPQARRVWHGFAAGEGRFFPQGHGALLGARLGVLAELATFLSATLDVGVLAGTHDDRLGEVRSVLTTLGFGLLAHGGHTVRLGVGPRVEAGLGSFRGEAMAPGATDARARSALVFAGLTGTLSFAIAGPCSGLMAVDGGATVQGFYWRAGTRRTAEVRGPMVSLRLGLTF